LERTLEYLGMSMKKDQVVNTSIDGEEEGGVRRALIPSHLLNANHWFNKYMSSAKKERLRAQLKYELEVSKRRTREIYGELEASEQRTRVLELKIAAFV
jgi:hypothetical protein